MSLSWVCLTLGVIVSAISLQGLDRGELERPANVLGLKESAFGALIGVALQDPIHLYWHGGEGHEHAEAGEFCSSCGVVHEEEVHAPKEEGRLVTLKKRLRAYQVQARKSNSIYGKSDEHIRYERKEMEDVIRLAYEMDPSNYENYNVYHLVSNTVSAHGANVDVAIERAEKTLSYCLGKGSLDPSVYMTAVSAADNMMIYKDLHFDKFNKSEVWEAHELMFKCMQEFESVLEKAEKDGRLEKMSDYRLEKLMQRYESHWGSWSSYKIHLEQMPKIYR